MNRYLEAFEEHRALLFGIAWRMLGNTADAEDILQEALVRWERTDIAEIRRPRAFLVTMVTRLCLNHLDLSRVKREVLVGREGVLDSLPSIETGPATDTDLADALDAAFSVVLQCLTPVERAVFLLREVFDRDYSEIARIVEKSEENCRQILRRARERIAGQERRFVVSQQQQEIALQEFLAATTTGDVQRLARVLANEVALVRDGENLGAPAPPPLRGLERVVQSVMEAIRRTSMAGVKVRFGPGGVPFVLSYEGGVLRNAWAIFFRGAHIKSIYQIGCPVRLKSLAAQFIPGPERS